MIKKVLIANRGEIAVRIIRACHEMDIETVAIYSEADQDSLHVRLADEAYCIGSTSPSKSYLNIESIMGVALSTGVDAIHPGYGFLAENPNFAEVCSDFNIIFVGPSSEAIRKMGTKDVARKTMESAGVPIVPGSSGKIEDVETALKVTEKIQFPVIIKAVSGGGGRGIRIARTPEELKTGLVITQQEAEVAFGNPSVYIEKYIEDFRHIEIQILADHHGNVIHLGERDCSIQRRLQKLLEEAPSPAISAETRAEMGVAAVNAAKAVNYSGAGTVEFIYEPTTGNFYFMEMNTRIQVEHPVTEMVTGIDLIKEQLLVASGEKLSLSQNDITFQGWAIECRINAENPEKEFMPSPGTVKNYLAPGGFGIRVDSALYPGYVITPFYDSMVAKVIVHGHTREEAVAKMKRALSELEIVGIETTIPFHLKLLNHKEFISGDFNTNFLDEHGVMEVQLKNVNNQS